MKYYLIVPASGEGKRFGSKIPKQFLKLSSSGCEVIFHTLKKFNSISLVSSIVIATNPQYIRKVKDISVKGNFTKVKNIVPGGESRQQSVLNALNSLNCSSGDIIIIHDAVRPFISKKKINEMCKLAPDYDCLIPGLKVNDTVKKINHHNFVEETIPRDNIWRIQTPQFFKYGKLIKAFQFAAEKKIIGTDEASLIEAAGMKVKITEGEVTNIKITTKEDLKTIDFNKLLSR